MRAVCAECVSRGLDGPAIIGTDKPCVEECTGKRFMGTQGKERASGNGEEKVTMGSRNVEAVQRGIQSESEYCRIQRKIWSVSGKMDMLTNQDVPMAAQFLQAVSRSLPQRWWYIADFMCNAQMVCSVVQSSHSIYLLDQKKLIQNL